MRSFLRLKNRNGVLPIRTFHSTSKLNARVRDAKGQPLYTHTEFMDNYRRGFENGGGNWKDQQSKSNTTGKYSEAELKAALEEGMKQADLYVGGAIRGAWDDGFAHGKPVGREEERVTLEQRAQEERAQNELRFRRLVEETKKTSYTAGLAANPDIIKAKKEGHIEGEKEGRLQAENTAAKNMEKIIKESDERFAAILLAVEEKNKNAKEQIISEYRQSRKISTRLMKPVTSIIKWGNRVLDESKQFGTHPSLPVNYRSYFLNQLYQIPKKVGEIPLVPFTAKVYRPSKHGQPDASVIGWGYNNQNDKYDYSKQYFYHSDYDKPRIKDLFCSKILQSNNTASPIGLKLRVFLALGSIAFLAELILATYDMYSHGEDIEQFSSRKNVNRLCETVKISAPKLYNTTAFTKDEEEKIKECKQGCIDAMHFQNKMRLEMQARRMSGHGDPLFFGPRQLEGVYADTLNAVADPLVKTIHNTDDLIRKRVESEMSKNVERENEEQQALKKKQYEEILASKQPSKGLRG